MRRKVTHAEAVAVFFLHCVVGIIIFFGWLWPAIWPLYITIITYTLFQNWILGYCILSKWEFSLRRMLNPKLRYQYNFTTYYTYKLTHRRLSTRFVQIAGTCFLTASLGIQLYFHTLPIL